MSGPAVAFNPDKYLAEKMAAPAFDPDAYLASKLPPPEAPSKTESALRGAAQGATLGFADEIGGAAEALWEKAKGDPKEFGELYKKHRDESRKAFDAAKKENPGMYTAGEVGGTLASTLIPGLGIANDAKLAGVVGKSALAGGLAGAGYSDKENPDEVAVDAAKGAVAGGVLGGVASVAAPYIGSAASKLGEKFNDTAESLAARALGAERSTVKKLGIDKIREVGRHALDEGVISPLASTEDMIERNAALKAKGGDQMGEVYKAIDDKGASIFNPFDVAGKVDDKIGNFYRSPINRGETNQLQNTLEAITMRGSQDIPLQDAQTLKQELGKVANWKNNINITDKEKMARDAYGVVSKAINDAAESGAKAIGKEGLEDTLKAGKLLYGKSSDAEKLLENKQAREQGNKLLGLTDWGILGASAPAAALTHGATVIPTVAAVAVKKAAEKFGAQNAALLFNKLGKSLSPKVVESLAKNPTLLKTVLTQGIESNVSGGPPVLRAVAQSAQPAPAAPTKGPDKWANDGLKNLQEHDPKAAAKIQDVKDDVIKSPKGKQLLIAASDLKPGSKAMNDVAERLLKLYGSTSSKH